MEVKVNLVAVLVSLLVSVVIGMVWYSPKVFGRTWVKLAKIDPKKGDMKMSMISVFVSGFIMAYVLAHLTYLSNRFFGHSYMQDALTTGFWVWLGFQGLRMFMHDQFNQRKQRESLIHIGNDLVTIMAMAAVIGAFGI